MTIKELMQKTCSSVYIVDDNNKCLLTPWNVFFEVFQDYVIDYVESAAEGDLYVTLKKQLVKKEG